MDVQYGFGMVLALGREMFFDDSDGEEIVTVPKIKNFAEEVVPTFSSNTFQSHFRMSPETFENILIKINSVVDHKLHMKHHSTSIEKEFMITLWYLANTESFRCVADRFDVSKSTCWEILYRTCQNILKINEKFKIIAWPDELRADQIMREFHAINGFPGIIGAIDGSHIKIRKPKEYPNSYCNRKGFHSVLLQGICDSRMLFIDVYAGEPGSIHDMRLLKKSNLYERIRNNTIFFPEESHMIGDLAYSLSPKLLVGFKKNRVLNREEKKFNQILSICRVVIEHAFGLLKSKFLRLKFLENVRLDLVSMLIVSCCVLHNLCILSGDWQEPIDTQDDNGIHGIGEENNNQYDDRNEQQDGILKRLNIMNQIELNQNLRRQ